MPSRTRNTLLMDDLYTDERLHSARTEALYYYRVTVQPMVSVKDDECDRHCHVCRHDTPETNYLRKLRNETYLTQFEVEWDPTITF